MRPRIAPLAAAALLGLGGIDAVLLGVIVEGFIRDDRAPSAKVEWRPRLSGAGDGAPDIKPINAYQQTIARPIFFKTREPFVPPPPVPAPPPPAPPKVVVAPPLVVDPGFVLGGVIIAREVRKAYLLTRTDPRGAWVTEGDDIGGWKVESIDGGGAKLQKDNRTIEVLLYAPN